MPSSAEGAILVVDDNEANRRLAQSVLEDDGYRVVVARGGNEALECFDAERIGCVLLDVRMPGVDGFGVCEALRQRPGGAELPIIFLTALRDVETFERALRAGGDDFLTKPIRPAELVIRVESALKLRELRSTLREQYEVLKHQRDDLLRLQLHKERLMAFVIHDLKNPVGAMDLQAQLLLRDATLSAAARKGAEHIRSAASRLSRMILNLLDISRGDEGKLVPKVTQVNLAALVQRVEDDLELVARACEVRLESTVEGATVEADEELLARTLVNVMENAIRHAPPKSPVRLEARRDDRGLEIRIADLGRGIPPEVRAQIFEPFVRIEQHGEFSSRAGHGLGLTFCRLAVEAHGGSIRIQDGNPGAVFVLRLPQGPAGQLPARAR